MPAMTRIAAFSADFNDAGTMSFTHEREAPIEVELIRGSLISVSSYLFLMFLYCRTVRTSPRALRRRRRNGAAASQPAAGQIGRHAELQRKKSL